MIRWWITLISLSLLSCPVIGVLFTASPRRLDLHGSNVTTSLTLSCSIKHTKDVANVYLIEVGRTAHGKSVPIAQTTGSGHDEIAILDKPNAHRMKINGTIDDSEQAVSNLVVRLTDLWCEDVTSYYCHVYYVTSALKGIHEDRCIQTIKASGVTLDISPTYIRVNDSTNTSLTLHCAFKMANTILYQLEIWRKTDTSRSWLVIANRTNIPTKGQGKDQMRVEGNIRGQSDMESWITATLYPVSCAALTTYYCRAVYVTRNITRSHTDEVETKGSCNEEEKTIIDTTISELNVTQESETILIDTTDSELKVTQAQKRSVTDTTDSDVKIRQDQHLKRVTTTDNFHVDEVTQDDASNGKKYDLHPVLTVLTILTCLSQPHYY